MKFFFLSLMTFASLASFANDNVEVSRCTILSTTDSRINVFSEKINEKQISIKQYEAQIFNEEKGLRGLNAWFNFTIDFEGITENSFLSTGSAIEAHKRSSKRIANSGLIEVTKSETKRLAVFETNANAMSDKSFEAKLTVLAPTGEPNLHIYLLECKNIHN
jgi:hypothetical protein